MPDGRLQAAVSTVPAGAWAVGVSGGADSVALLSLLRGRTDLRLHVAHLDHQTRGAASTGDAEFVARLAQEWNIPGTIALREQIEPMLVDPPANTSALYRACRIELYRQVITAQRLGGVILAHHADDQAETVLQRLARGASYPGLAGMGPQAVVKELRIVRPLLTIRRVDLREYLQSQGVAWREDASNQSDAYQRNRLRKVLDRSEPLFEAMMELGHACADLRDWSRSAAPILPERFNAAQLARVPQILAEDSARQWLADRGVPVHQIDAATIDRLLLMASDAASPSRLEFPGKVVIRRRAGAVFVDG